MPVAAAGLADILVGDPHPRIQLGLDDHRLEHAAVGLLDIGATGDLRLRLAETERERVAHPLQLRDVEHPRAADGADPPLDPLPGERRGEHLAEAQLKPGDLGSQVVADAPLVDPRSRGEDTSSSAPEIAPLVLEYRWHGG